MEKYFLFTLKNGLVDNCFGPLFEYELEYATEEYFDIYEKVESLPESMFKILHPEKYFEEKRGDWTTFLSILFEEYDYIIPEYYIADDDNCIDNEYFGIFKDPYDENNILMTFSLSCDPLVAGLISHLTTQYLSDVFTVTFCSSGFYYSLNNEYLMDNEAIKTYNREKVTNFISQN